MRIAAMVYGGKKKDEIGKVLAESEIAPSLTKLQLRVANFIMSAKMPLRSKFFRQLRRIADGRRG